MRRIPRLSRAEERALARRLRAGDHAAAEKLILAHLRFVVFIARLYRRHGLPLADLVQEGTIGLIQAVQRFNPERDVRLASYAMWSIRAAIQDYVIRSRSLVRMGTTAAQKSVFLNLWRKRGEWTEETQAGGDELTRKLAERFNMSLTDVVGMARRMARPDKSLDVPASDESVASWLDYLRDDGPTPEEALDRRRNRSLIARALAKLPPRERLIVVRRFMTDKAPSRAALAKELGLSKERIRQLEIRALGRLRATIGPALDDRLAA